MRLADKIAVITGAAGILGDATARRFAAEGAQVVVADLDASAGQRVTDAIRDGGGQASFVRCNVASAAEVQAMVQHAVDTFGGLDILVNNAGFTHPSKPVCDVTEAEYDAVFATNTKGVWLGVKYAVPQMRKRGGGVIINTASIGAVAPRPGVTVYNATKGAVMTMTRGLATELAADNIRVNAVNPVAADTHFMRGAFGKPDLDKLSDRARERLISGIPLGRLTEPADVAACVAFLACDEACFLTGVCLPIDGGRSIS